MALRPARDSIVVIFSHSSISLASSPSAAVELGYGDTGSRKWIINPIQSSNYQQTSQRQQPPWILALMKLTQKRAQIHTISGEVEFNLISNNGLLTQPSGRLCRRLSIFSSFFELFYQRQSTSSILLSSKSINVGSRNRTGQLRGGACRPR